MDFSFFDPESYTAKIKNVWFEKTYDHQIIANAIVFEDKRGRFPDNTSIHTSAIERVDKDSQRIYTQNSVYQVEDTAVSFNAILEAYENILLEITNRPKLLKDSL